MNELALFAGAGGGLLGSRLLGWRTICAVEINPYCRRVLMQRQNDGVLDPFPIWDDVRTFDGTAWRGKVDVVTGGFPCQPFSVAGKQRSSSDSRNLWPEVVRILDEVRPYSGLMENVPALLADQYYGHVLRDLATLWGNARWCVLGSSGLGAHCVGQRLWFTTSSSAASGVRREGGGKTDKIKNATDYWGRSQFERLVRYELEHGVPAGSLGRISDGVAHRVDRLRAIGNGQVPFCVARAWIELAEGFH